MALLLVLAARLLVLLVRWVPVGNGDATRVTPIMHNVPVDDDDAAAIVACGTALHNV